MDTRYAIGGMLGSAILGSALTIIVLPIGNVRAPAPDSPSSITRNTGSSSAALAVKEALIEFDARLNTGVDLEEYIKALASVSAKVRFHRQDLSEEQAKASDIAVSAGDAGRAIWTTAYNCKGVEACTLQMYSPMKTLGILDQKNLMFIAYEQLPALQAEERERLVNLVRQRVSASVNLAIEAMS